MQARDLGEWQKQLAELDADANPTAQQFSQFVQSWGDHAEGLLLIHRNGESLGMEPGLTPIEALRRTLRLVEEERGILSIGFLGMALVVLCSHWLLSGDPNEFFASMSPIEQNLFHEVATLKLAEMSASAAK